MLVLVCPSNKDFNVLSIDWVVEKKYVKIQIFFCFDLFGQSEIKKVDCYLL